MDDMQVQFGFTISFPKTTFLLLDNYSNLACEYLMPSTFYASLKMGSCNHPGWQSGLLIGWNLEVFEILFARTTWMDWNKIWIKKNAWVIPFQKICLLTTCTFQDGHYINNTVKMVCQHLWRVTAGFLESIFYSRFLRWFSTWHQNIGLIQW